mgnify:CR=1 FL=1
MAKILIIDDEQPIRRMLSTLFERNGYEVLTASDGNKGLAATREFNPDLIITDLLMPEKEGLETIKEIREIDTEVKIIAISGGGVVQPEMYLKLAEKVGADMSMTKPVDNATLISSVKQLIDN